MKKISKILLTATIATIFSVNNVFAEIFKKIPLNINEKYIISFDSPVKQFNTDVKNAILLEIPVNLYNDKNIIIIKPLKETSILLKITTKSEIYNFNININKTNKFIPVKESSFELSEMDKPPTLKKEKNNFELDSPPLLKNTLEELDSPPIK